MGPESAKSHPGTRVIRSDPSGATRIRATQEIDYGRRGKGYVFGAFEPANGTAFTAPYDARTIANWCAFLDQVDAWVDEHAKRVYAVLDNLSTHRATDVLLWSAGPSPVGVRLPTDLRRLPQFDRTVVEDPALLGAERSALRDLGPD